MERDPTADERSILLATAFQALLALVGVYLVIMVNEPDLLGAVIALFVALALSVGVVALLHTVTFLHSLRMVLARALIGVQSLALLVAIVWSVISMFA